MNSLGAKCHHVWVFQMTTYRFLEGRIKHVSLWSDIPGTKYLFYSLQQCFGLIANCCSPGLRCRENCPSFMYFWQIAAFAACFAFIPNCCPQRICQSIRWKVGWRGSTLFKSRLVYFLPKMPTLHGQTTSVTINTLPQK